jgi:hypothetical protein
MTVSMTYAPRVPLVACPFCREMYEESERETCPICGVALTPFEKLPPSPESRVDDDGIPVEPQHEPLRMTDMRRGKGALTALGFMGLVLFFLPWVHMTRPEVTTFSGFDLARRLGWSWGAAVCWVVLLPTVLSRESIHQLRGARVAAAFLSCVPAVTVALLLARPPAGGLVPIHFDWGWPMYATLAASLVATGFSLRLGGRVDDIRVTRGSSQGHALH